MSAEKYLLSQCNWWGPNLGRNCKQKKTLRTGASGCCDGSPGGHLFDTEHKTSHKNTSCRRWTQHDNTMHWSRVSYRTHPHGILQLNTRTQQITLILGRHFLDSEHKIRTHPAPDKHNNTLTFVTIVWYNLPLQWCDTLCVSDSVTQCYSCKTQNISLFTVIHGEAPW